MFALKLDSAGNFKWAKQLGFAYGESSSIIVDTAANVYIGGRTSSGDLYVYKMSQPAGLPVVLVAFEAVNKGTDAYLWWKTTNEFNNDKFVIERSLDGTAFSEIGEVKADQNATTTSNYSFLDINARTKFPGINLFYRFRQVDRDGRFTHSPVRSVKFNSSAPSIQIFPNPAKDVMTIKQDDFQPGLSFLLTNQSGITMMTSVLKNQTTTVNINHLSAGVYYVQIVGSNQKPIKVIKK